MYCDVHAVGLRSRHYLVTARQATMGTVVFSAIRSQAIQPGQELQS
jgi:hypothetical protein